MLEGHLEERQLRLPNYIVTLTTTNKEQCNGTTVPFLSRDIATENDFGTVQIIALRVPA